jgi:hypothetical protein
MPSDSEEEEEHQLQHPKRTLPGFPKLPDEVVLSGKIVNDILVVSFTGEVPTKNPRTNVSPAVNPTKVINPHPISSALPHTREATHASQNVINIVDDPEPDPNTYSTIIAEQSPPPPSKDTTVPLPPNSPEPMQLDIPENLGNFRYLLLSVASTPSQSNVPVVSTSVTLPSMESQQSTIPELTQFPQVPLLVSQSPRSKILIEVPQVQDGTPEVPLITRTKNSTRVGVSSTTGDSFRTEHNVIEREVRANTPRSATVLRTVTTLPGEDESYPFTSDVPEEKTGSTVVGTIPRRRRG